MEPSHKSQIGHLAMAPSHTSHKCHTNPSVLKLGTAIGVTAQLIK
jgi:hypothetical protein